MNLSLLHTPDGVRDFYGAELDLKNHIMESFEKNISLYGYNEIQTPTLEFLNVFLEDEDVTFESKTFRFIDRDGDTLVLRPDYTPSVARCAVKYFSDETGPLRFFYKGNAFSNKGIYEGKAIEVTQMGIELLKDDSVLADAEVIEIVIKNLLSIGLKEFKICINTKEDNTDRIDKVLAVIDNMGYSEYVSYDPDIDSNFKYYTGMVFKAYTYGVGDSICKGGRYNSLLSKYGEGSPAVGCVFMIDTIQQSLKKQKIVPGIEKAKCTYIVYDEGKEFDAVKDANELRNSGFKCITVSKKVFEQDNNKDEIIKESEVLYI